MKSKLLLSQDKDIIQIAEGMAVLESGSIIVTDPRAAKIKTYDSNGQLVKQFGRHGQGPNEFDSPMILDYAHGKLALYDWARDIVYIYSISTNGPWKETDRFYGSFDDLKIMDNGYLFAGPKSSKEGGWYRGFIRKTGSNDLEFLFPFNEIYGMPGKNDGMNMNVFRDISNIGIRTFIDYDENAFYSVWEGALAIHRLDRTTGGKASFGKATALYRQPKVTPALIQANRDRMLKQYYSEVAKFSTIVKVIAAKKSIIVIYMNSDLEQNDFYPIVQRYSKEGRLLGESVLRESRCPYNKIPCYFDRNDESLYFISTVIGSDNEPEYFLHRYWSIQ